MKQTLQKASILISVFLLLLGSYDTFQRHDYGVGMIYMLCVGMYIVVWRLATKMPVRIRLVTIIGSVTLALAFLDYFKHGKEIVSYVYLGASVFNMVPLFLGGSQGN